MPTRLKQRIAAWLTLLGLLAACPGALADGQDERRALVGLKLFPAMIAADLAIADKVSADGQLELVVLYGHDRSTAERLAERLSEFSDIRELPIAIRVLPLNRLPELWDTPPAGIFIADWIRDGLEEVVRFGRIHGRITFSPYRGDVERGVLGGIHVSDRILPFVNIDTLGASGISLRPFFLKVARPHE